MPRDLAIVDPDSVEPVIVGPGCARRDLPSPVGVRAWIVDMTAGARWPSEDVHDEYGEVVFVLAGELIEGDRTVTPGSYLVFGPNSRHRPRTDTGVRLFGFNLTPAEQ